MKQFTLLVFFICIFSHQSFAGNYNPNGKIDIYVMRKIPRKWYPVYKYKGKFYILSLNFFNKDLLTDTAFLRSSMEGVFSNVLNSFKKINKNTFQLNANTWHNKTFNLKIHIIDTAKGLAVFEYFTSGDKKHDYRLMVGGEGNIRSFPLIASFSRTRILPDTTWYPVKPANFYIEFFNAKSLLNKENDN